MNAYQPKLHRGDFDEDSNDRFDEQLWRVTNATGNNQIILESCEHPISYSIGAKGNWATTYSFLVISCYGKD